MRALPSFLVSHCLSASLPKERPSSIFFNQPLFFYQAVFLASFFFFASVLHVAISNIFSKKIKDLMYLYSMTWWNASLLQYHMWNRVKIYKEQRRNTELSIRFNIVHISPLFWGDYCKVTYSSISSFLNGHFLFMFPQISCFFSHHQDQKVATCLFITCPRSLETPSSCKCSYHLATSSLPKSLWTERPIRANVLVSQLLARMINILINKKNHYTLTMFSTFSFDTSCFSANSVCLCFYFKCLS